MEIVKKVILEVREGGGMHLKKHAQMINQKGLKNYQSMLSKQNQL